MKEPLREPCLPAGRLDRNPRYGYVDMGICRYVNMWRCGEIGRWRDLDISTCGYLEMGRFRCIEMEEPLREPWWESEI